MFSDDVKQYRLAEVTQSVLWRSDAGRQFLDVTNSVLYLTAQLYDAVVYGDHLTSQTCLTIARVKYIRYYSGSVELLTGVFSLLEISKRDFLIEGSIILFCCFEISKRKYLDFNISEKAYNLLIHFV